MTRQSKRADPGAPSSQGAGPRRDPFGFVVSRVDPPCPRIPPGLRCAGMTEPDEHVYHVDRDDNIIGRVTRAEAHRRGLLHRAGCVLVRDRQGRVFLARRARTKAIFPGYWDWPCSFHVSWGEAYDQAAARELFEETGIRDEPLALGTVLVDEDPDHLIVRAYLLIHDGPLRLDPLESESGDFVEPQRVEELLRTEPTTSWLRPTWALLAHLRGEARDTGAASVSNGSPEACMQKEPELKHISCGNEPEIALPSGRLSRGVVRIGATVRRPSTASSPFVAQLLGRFETLGVPWAPRYLGQDELARDVLTFLPGSVPPKWRRFTDQQVCDAGRLLRRFHDATRGSALAAGQSVVCHNDPGPNNVVFQQERPAAFIDFDMAAPGEPIEDLGYMAWSWCISSKHDRQPVALQASQLRLLADAYGLQSGRHELVSAILERIERNTRFWIEKQSAPETTAVTTDKIQEIIEWSRRELAYAVANRQSWRRHCAE
jgi:isopentenyldiphosphate isomerase